MVSILPLPINIRTTNSIKAKTESGYSLDSALAPPLGQDYKLKLGYFRFDDGINDSSSSTIKALIPQ